MTGLKPTLSKGEHNEPLALEPRELFDPCILGQAQRFDSYFLVYDQQCVIKAIATDAGTDWETALEHFLFNVVGSWVGQGTPAFQLPLPEDGPPDWEAQPPGPDDPGYEPGPG